MKEGSGVYKVITVIPCWKRPEVLEMCLKNLAWFSNQVKTWEVTPLLVLSPEDPDLKKLEKAAKKYAIKSVYYPNLPISAKLNAGLHYALRHYDFDYLMNFGSDDLIHPRIEALFAGCFKEKVLFFGVNNLWFYDLTDKTAYHFRTYNDIRAIGAGRMIHRSIVEAFIDHRRYPIYPNDIDRGMDGQSSLTIERVLKIKDCVIDSGEFPYIVDLKTNTNINHIIAIKSHVDRIKTKDPNELRTIYKHVL